MRWERALAALVLLTSARVSSASAEAEVREVVERVFRADALGAPEELGQAFAPGATVLEKRGSRWVKTDALSARTGGPAADESRRVRRVESLKAGKSEASAVK